MQLSFPQQLISYCKRLPLLFILMAEASLADQATALGRDSASAQLNFRITIPARLSLSLSQTLDAPINIISNAGPLLLNSSNKSVIFSGRHHNIQIDEKTNFAASSNGFILISP